MAAQRGTERHLIERAPAERVPERRLMQRAIALAERGGGKTGPNPMVGCVVAKHGKVIAEGWHKCCGAEHAEAMALRLAGKKARGAEMYVTLEPCSHWGRTPPCTRAIMRAGIKKVFIAMRDPNQGVSGEGIRALRSAGIKVHVGLCKKEAETLNNFYITRMRRGRPFVIMKVAMTADGKITWGNGKRKKISGKEVDELVHRMRARVDAVIVGVNTVIKDNPLLTARLGKNKNTKNARGSGLQEGGIKNPLRVVLDCSLRIPANARVLKCGGGLKTAVVAAAGARRNARKAREIQKRGAAVMVVKRGGGGVDLHSLLHELGSAGINSVMLEGGKKLNTSFLRAGLADEAVFIVSPRRIGKGLDWAERRVAKGVLLDCAEAAVLGKDVVISGVPSLKSPHL
ncbi:MAG: bifunctional diaminohydroxyphosphoribosylaminopyrimidine deaminase/5-amino-6-(5-phosphoribosylamino)uracil reductase RibD [Candidatus Diapherotrites archaeon]